MHRCNDKFSAVRTFPYWAGILPLALLLASCTQKKPADDKDLVVNGSFESPAAPSALIIDGIKPGEEPKDFGWKVVGGDVDLTAAGYSPTGGKTFSGPVADGHQWLDLDGYVPGAIVQTIPTIPDAVYTLTFDYANNPDPDAHHPFNARVRVLDAATSTDLIAPVNITHSGSTLDDYHWTHAGPITFTATGKQTTIRFASKDIPTSHRGIALDDISVKIISRPIFIAGNFMRYGLPVLGLVGLALIMRLLAGARRAKNRNVPNS